MSRLLQSTTSSATARQRSRARLAAIIPCALALALMPTLAGAQSGNAGVGIVQPTGTPAAERHRARVTGDNPSADMPLVQAPAPITARRHSPLRGAEEVQHSRPINRTAQAHLKTSRQALGLPAVSMICLDCEPGPPTCPPRLYDCPKP